MTGKQIIKKSITALLWMESILLLFPKTGFAQQPAELHAIKLDHLAITALGDHTDQWYPLAQTLPLVDFELDGAKYSTISLAAGWRQKLAIDFEPDKNFSPGFKGTVTFKNISPDTLSISNVVPLGGSPGKVFITSLGNNPMSRAYLFLPNRRPVNIIVPDNAWELGFSESRVKDSLFVCALARRDGKHLEKGALHRFETLLYPGGKISYDLYADFYTGPWQQGLREIFQQRYLYDVKDFNDSIFQRKDLQWIRKAYIIHLLMAWDHQFYDDRDQQYHLTSFLKKGIPLYGGDDVVGIWPTWPSLGVDQRNQFDLFRDLPGGIAKIRSVADSCHQLGCNFFICYNPWDESTRREGQLSGLADIIRQTNADGVVLDTRGASSHELQAAADSVKKGTIMYPEGMAVPKDMQGVVAGRVHNNLYYPPMLNLNKFIKPEFAIFRVTEVYKEPIRREFSLAFFNGYGTEINMFSPGIPENLNEEYRYLGKTTRILRENNLNFISEGYTPLISTDRDSIWVNEWPLSSKTVYTIYSIISGGYKGFLFEAKSRPGTHFVDLWRHEEIPTSAKTGASRVLVQTDAFNASWLGTNNEGAVDCIAQFPLLLLTSLTGDRLTVYTPEGMEVHIWAGNPSYGKKPVVIRPGENTLRLSEAFAGYEGKFVIQLFKEGELMDERVYEIAPGTALLASKEDITTPVARPPRDMVRIPAGSFTFHTTHGDDFISYPAFNEDSIYTMRAFYMDKFPVTNQQFKAFIDATNYRPRDTANFLKDWVHGAIPPGEEQFPVVYVSYEDARAYAKWAGKRLPTEVEWQYGAQTPGMSEWPWKQKKPVRWSTQVVTNTLIVKRPEGIDPRYCNLGNGQLYPVGKYKRGANPYGLEDLVGCVWQLTNDIYQDGSYRYIIMKGGSYFNPSSSWWYVQGGPRPLTYRQFLLRVSPGFERNATVGFRCVKDAPY